MLAFKLHSFTATKPVRSFANDVGYKLSASECKTVPARSRCFVETDVSFSFPVGYFGLIVPIEELVSNYWIDVSSAVVKNGMEAIQVMLINNSDLDFKIDIGDKIAFMSINKYFEHYLLIENKD